LTSSSLLYISIAKEVSDKWYTILPILFPNDSSSSSSGGHSRSNGSGAPSGALIGNGSSSGSGNSDIAVGSLTWDSFIRGWVHAAEAVRHATPTSFQASLNGIKKWEPADAADPPPQQGQGQRQRG
jgi:hypothetical protein